MQLDGQADEQQPAQPHDEPRVGRGAVHARGSPDSENSDSATCLLMRGRAPQVGRHVGQRHIPVQPLAGAWRRAGRRCLRPSRRQPAVRGPPRRGEVPRGAPIWPVGTSLLPILTCYGSIGRIGHQNSRSRVESVQNSLKLAWALENPEMAQFPHVWQSLIGYFENQIDTLVGPAAGSADRARGATDRQDSRGIWRLRSPRVSSF